MWRFMLGGLLRSLGGGRSIPAPPARGLPTLAAASCEPCDACYAVCPTRAFSRDDAGKPVLDAGACLQCGLCVATCPNHALRDGHFDLTAVRQRADLRIPLGDVPGGAP